jgi:hypothetical protein
MSYGIDTARRFNEVDYDNPLANDLKFAVIAKSDDATDVVNLVNGTRYSDGGNSYRFENLRGDGSYIYPDNSLDFYNESFIFMADLYLGDLSPASGGNEINIFEITTNATGEGFALGYYIHYSTGRGGISFQARLNYAGYQSFDSSAISEGEYTNVRGLVVWDHVAKRAEFRVNGSVYRAYTFSSFNRTFESFRFKLPYTTSGDNTSSLASAFYLKRSTPFTSEEVDSLADKPYSLIKSYEAVAPILVDYGLKLPANGSRAQVALNYPAPANVFFELDITIYSASTEYPSVQFGLFHDANSNYRFGLSFTNQNYIRVQCRDSAISFGGAWSAGERMTLRIERKGQASPNDWASGEFYKNGSKLGNVTSGKPTFTFNDLRIAHDNDVSCLVHSFRYEDDNGNIHNWDCNQTQGSEIPDLIGNKNAVTVSITYNSSYIVENNEIVGYKLTSSAETITLTMSGAFEGVITYSDNSTVAISGSGNYVLDGTTPIIIAKVTATDTASSFDWDFTTGDSNQIIETLQYNHAATPSKTSGWMPIVDTQAFTAQDYPLLSSFVTAESNANYLAKFIGPSSAGSAISGFPNGLVVEDGEFTSNVTLTTVGTAEFRNMKMLDVDATGATGDVLILDSEAQNVTG